MANVPELLVVDTAEQEAWAAATSVMDHMAQGHAPVALVAQDRLLVRRVRALLERRGLRVFDEAGWTLSTTRAASRLMALLHATSPSAGPDAWLDGLKVLAQDEQLDQLDALELHWRRHGTGGQLRHDAPDRLQQAQAWWREVELQWQRFAAPARQTLFAWLTALDELAVLALGSAPWRSDPASLAVRAALRLDSGHVRADIDEMLLTPSEFVAWVDQVLEQATFVDRAGAEQAQVVITPMARAIASMVPTAISPNQPWSNSKP